MVPIHAIKTLLAQIRTLVSLVSAQVGGLEMEENVGHHLPAHGLGHNKNLE